jgi:lysophospholipase L1-like esterase
MMDVKNICVFGDSITKGVVLHPITCHYEIIKTNIGQFLGLNKTRIQNYSMFGCTVSKALSLVQKRSNELQNYQHVFLELGGNDCNFVWGEIAEDPGKEHLPKTPLVKFKELYRQVVSEIRSHGSNPIILTLPPLEPNRFFTWVSKGINGDNILNWLGDVDMIYRWQEMYNIEVMKLAATMDVPMIDIRSAFLTKNHYQDLICADGIHPTNEGYNLIYQTISEQYPN